MIELSEIEKTASRIDCKEFSVFAGYSCIFMPVLDDWSFVRESSATCAGLQSKIHDAIAFAVDLGRPSEEFLAGEPLALKVGRQLR